MKTATRKRLSVAVLTVLVKLGHSMNFSWLGCSAIKDKTDLVLLFNKKQFNETNTERIEGDYLAISAKPSFQPTVIGIIMPPADTPPDQSSTDGKGDERRVVDETKADLGVSSEGRLKVSEDSTQQSKQLIVGETKEGKNKGDGSWAGIVQSKQRMQQYDMEVCEVEGVQTFKVPTEVFEDSRPLWEDLLIGKFLSNAPYVGKIHAIVNRIWTLGDKSIKVDVFVVNQTTVKFRITDKVVRNRVLRRGMWNLCDIPMIVTKWSPNLEEMQPAMKSIPLWVIVKNVPASMFAWKGLSCLTSPIGKPIRLHPDTEQCKSFEEGRVFVEVNLTKPLPAQHNFELQNGEKVLVTYTYPWLPPRCKECSTWGHTGEECVRKSVKTAIESERRDETVDENKSNTDPRNEETTAASPEESAEIQNPIENEVPPGQINEEKKDEGWSTPTKVAKTPEKEKTDLKYGEVSLLARSRYSALSDKGEDGLELEESEEEMEEGEVKEKESGEDDRSTDKEEAMHASVETLVTSTNILKEEVGGAGATRQSLRRATKDAHKVIKMGNKVSSTQTGALKKGHTSKPY